MTSINDGIIADTSDDSSTSELAARIVAAKLAWLAHEQQPPLVPSLRARVSQAGRSQTSSHFGLGQVIAFLHFQSHLVASHIGVHTAFGASHWVRQLAGEQTVSHLGQSFFSHKSFGQRTLHCGLSQWILHLAHSVSSQWIWHFGLSHTGWHTAGHTGSSHCHLHSGWQSPSTSIATTAEKAKETNRRRRKVVLISNEV